MLLSPTLTGQRAGTLTVISTTYKNLADNSTNGDRATFTNDYNPEDTLYIPEVRKIVTGEDRPENKETFHFTLTQKSGPTGGATLHATTATVVDEGTAQFGQIDFTKKGTYVFEIVEEPGSNGHYTYDEHSWTLTIVVRDDADGNLYVVGGDGTNPVSATNKIQYVRNDDTTNDIAEFSNNYAPDPTSYKPMVEKKVTVDYGPLVADKTFHFTLEAADGNPTTGWNFASDNSKSATVTVPAGQTNKTAFFGDVINFTKAGTYTFNVKETEENAAGITYDTTVWTLTVVVSDHDNSLQVDSTTYTAGSVSYTDRAVFENPYKPAPTEYTPQVEKIVTVDYGPLVADKTFDFILSKYESPKGISGSGWSIPDGGDHTSVTVLAGQTNGTASFGKITFTKPGTYEFEVREIIPDDADKLPGITYDTTAYILTVQVVDDDGQLRVASHIYWAPEHEDSTEQATFTNPYKPEPTDYTPKVEKIVTVDFGPTVAEKIFNFTLGFVKAVDKDGNPVEAGYTIPENGNKAQLTIPAGGTNGTVDFGEITFVKAGTYTFEAKETAEDEEGITYDATVWTLTLKVVDHDNDLQVDEVTYVAGDKTSTTQAAFTNPYKPEPTDYVPPVVKRIIGEPTVEDLTFNFTLEANEDYAGAKVTNGSTSITVPAGQTGEDIVGSFEKIDFTMAGTYSFTVKETKEDLEGITYDETVYTLTVVVEDMDGYLEVVSAVFEKPAAADPEGGEPTEAEPETEAREDALFINAYQPTPTAYAPEVTKFVTSLSGHTILKQESFLFTLTAADAKEEGSYWMDEDAQTFITTGDYWDRTIDFGPGEAPGADVPAGIATFDEITYMKSGTYTYTVVEEMGSATGWDYSEDVWTIIVEVVDKGGYLVKQSITYLLNDEEFLKVEATEIEGERVVDAVPAEGEAETEILGLTFTNDYSEGRQLPATGGRGTTIFYVMGSLLVVGAGVVLATRRRKAQ